MTGIAPRLMILRGLAGGISQRELARLAEISAAYPGLIERSDETAVSGVVATRLATVFGCSLDYILNGVGSPPPEQTVRAAVGLATTLADKRDAQLERAKRAKAKARKARKAKRAKALAATGHA